MTVLFPYQREGVDRIKELLGRALVADSMGLGKTLQALKHLEENPQCRPAVVICPASVKFHWESEALKHCGLRAAVLEGFRKKPRGRKFDLYISNYDILADQRRERKIRKGQWEFLKSLNPQTVILDEGQLVKNRGAKRTKAVRKLCEGVPGLIVLTGTPLVNRPAELFNVLNLLWPKDFPSFWSYARRHCSPKKTYFGWDFTGASRLGELHRNLKRLGMIRRKAWQVLDQLPKKRELVLPIPIERPEEYAEAKKDFIKWIRKTNPQKAKRAEKAAVLSQIGYLKRLAADLKAKSVMEWIDNFLEADKDKLAVFAIHKAFISRLSERYGKGCVVIDGSVATAKRSALVHKFQTDKRVRIFIGNVQAAGIGMDGLQKVCSKGLMAELPWTPGEVSQVIGRLARIGQTDPVTFWFLVAKDTIEAKLCELLQKKQGVLSQVMDGDKKAKELDIYNELLKELSKEK